MSTFEFYRFRFHFRALDPVRFPAGKSSNVVRGAFGALLRETAPGSLYTRLFEPGAGPGRGPSGLADWPRPFVFRTAHLDGMTVPRSEAFHFDAHLFDVRDSAVDCFRTAFSKLAEHGLGPERGRASLEHVEALDLADRPTAERAVLDLTPDGEPIHSVRVHFLSPTELKSGGVLAAKPEFPTLFGRLRDRIATLSALYGNGPLDLDFRGAITRASQIRMTHCDLVWHETERRSARTGQVHPLGGFTGQAEYEGDLAEFLPWLRAGRWTGVGRQTVWGKGDMRVIGPQANGRW